jgi:hemerythrin-like domain-containing protein
MLEFLNENIKDVIHRYPRTEDILKSHGIACVECAVGTCRLRDIIEIHNLDRNAEKAVLEGIAELVFPGQKFDIPAPERKPPSRNTKLSPPLTKLVQEHTVIKKLLNLAPRLIEVMESSPEDSRKAVQGALDFIRSFADRFHHAKEEDILFKYFDENAEIFQVMYQDHEQARAHVRKMQKALDGGNTGELRLHLLAYGDLLEEHIKKEDEVLYPWIDRNLSDSQVGELYTRFAAVDESFGDDPEQRRRFVEELEKRFS